MFLRLYRTVSPESVRAGHMVDLGDDRRLIVSEVRLTADKVEVGGHAPDSESTRRSWVTFKPGDEVRILATESEARGWLTGLRNALGLALSEWEDRNSDSGLAPPWTTAATAPLQMNVDGYWFTVELAGEPGAAVADVEGPPRDDPADDTQS